MEMMHTDDEQQDEEFQEADILWPDAPQGGLLLPGQVFYYSQADPDDGDDEEEHDEFSSDHRPTKLQIGRRASSPIDIPGRKGAAKGAKAAQPGLGSKPSASRASGSVMIGGSHVFVPPHVIVDWRDKREKAMMVFVVPSKRPARKMRGHNY